MKNISGRLICTLTVLLFSIFIILSCSKNTNTNTRRPVNTVTVTTNIKYGSNKDWKGNMQNLLLDTYVPADASAQQKFPLIVYVHGGGFQDGTKEDKRVLMNDFANAGFVAASINYRLGWTQTEGCNGDTTQAKEAIYRAVQDAKAAIRFLVANANTYYIDTSRIFLSGESAGAITILSSNYFTQTFANSFIPGVESNLGALDFADNDIKVGYSIKGLASVAGCLNNPDLINAANAKPTIYMHGLMDDVIPYNTGTTYNCKNFSKCYGDYYLYNISKNFVSSVMHLDSTGTHNVYTEDFIKTNQVCFFNSVMQNNTNEGYFTGNVSSCQ